MEEQRQAQVGDENKKQRNFMRAFDRVKERNQKLEESKKDKARSNDDTLFDMEGDEDYDLI